jgi:hypothetical protein
LLQHKQLLLQKKTKKHDRYNGYKLFTGKNQPVKYGFKLSLIKNSYTKPLYLQVWIQRHYLDRGKIGSTAIVKFNRVGNKILMIQPNYSFRKVITNDVAEKEKC